MAPQVASLSELSRIRGDAEVRYSYAITQPKLSPLGLDRDQEAMVKGLSEGSGQQREEVSAGTGRKRGD